MPGARRPAWANLDLSDGGGPVLDAWEGTTQTVRDELADRGEQTQEQADARSMALMDFAKLVPEVRGPIDFDRFPYQREWYDEHAAFDRVQVNMKANQVGDSTRQIRVGMFWANRGLSVIYTFPTLELLRKFSRKRLKPVIQRSDYLASRVSREHVDTIEQKQIGWGWMHFFGTEVPIEAEDADAIIVDEVDFSNQENLEQSLRRITGPTSAGLQRWLSVPTLPNYGIAARYETTDQRVWTVKCGACNGWNPMRGQDAWKNNVDKEARRIVCAKPKCRKPLDVRLGEWVPEFPDRDVRGYHTPKLIVAGTSIDELVANSEKTKPYERQAFVTRDLGEPYAPEEARLSMRAIRACVRGEFRPLESLRTSRLVVMGLDQAGERDFNVIIREAIDLYRTRLVWAGNISEWLEADRLMQALDVNMAGVDYAPEGHAAREFSARFPGRVYRMGYFDPESKGGQRRQDPPIWLPDHDERFVSLNRTQVIDTTLENFRQQKNLIPPLELLPSDYSTHLGNLVRQVEDTPTGNKRAFYASVGPDDYAHAEVYGLCAMEMFWHLSGLQQVQGQGPQPHPQAAASETHLADYSHEPEYRAGPEDDFGTEGIGGLE